MTVRMTTLSGAIAGTLLALGLCACGGECVASSPEWGEGGTPIGRAFGLEERSGTAPVSVEAESLRFKNGGCPPCSEAVRHRFYACCGGSSCSEAVRHRFYACCGGLSCSEAVRHTPLATLLRNARFARGICFYACCGGSSCSRSGLETASTLLVAAGSGADKFRLLPQTSVSSVVKTQSGQNILV